MIAPAFEEHRKKRRRRDVPPKPVSTQLAFDETIKGDTTLISRELAERLNIC